MPHLSPGLLRALPLVLVCIVIIHPRLPDSGTAANCSITATLPTTMLRYLPNQLLELNTRLAPSNIFALKQLGILRQPRYVHRGSRRRFVYSESRTENSIPSLWTAASGAHQRRHRMRHQSAHVSGLKNYNRPHPGPLLEEPRTARPGKRGVDHTVLRSLVKWTPSSMIKMELLNCQSLTNKASFIHNYIFDQKLDFMCLTETWHKSEVYSALNEACPPGYTYLKKARGNGNGGVWRLFIALICTCPL